MRVRQDYDVCVIGAGVVGCALARRYALSGARVVILEKAADILDGASKGNSAILHTGFDAPPGSLEQACIAEGYREYMEIRGRLNLPVLETGAMVIAWTEEEEAQLAALMHQARENGVADVEPLTRDQILQAEPNLAETLHAGFRVPGEVIIDPWSAPLAYLTQAVALGATLLRNAEVVGGAFDGTCWHLDTTWGALRARLVLNAAGLYGDRVDECLLGRSDFTIRPRKGQFVVYDKPAAALTRHILLPVPTKITKGIVICPTAFGNLLVGPTAEEQTERDCALLDADILAALRRRGEQILPGLKEQEVTAVYAGLRPATEEKRYRITYHEAQSYVSVGGIRSTGLSAALGIAAHVQRLTERETCWEPPQDVPWPTVPNISEMAPRDWQRPGHGGLVCQCELVTEREIAQALEGPLGAKSLAGLKRRTRATLGRCQGFHCLQRLSEVTEAHFKTPIAVPHG